MNQRIKQLKGLEKDVAYLSPIEVKELHTISKLYDQLIDDKFNLIDKMTKLKKEYSALEIDLLVLSREVRRVDSLRAEIVDLNFRTKQNASKRVNEYLPKINQI